MFLTRPQKTPGRFGMKQMICGKAPHANSCYDGASRNQFLQKHWELYEVLEKQDLRRKKNVVYCCKLQIPS